MAVPSAVADWREDQRQSILHGVQAVLMCNGLFTSHRSLDAVFAVVVVFVVVVGGV